jgi:hypothetical protein
MNPVIPPGMFPLHAAMPSICNFTVSNPEAAHEDSTTIIPYSDS